MPSTPIKDPLPGVDRVSILGLGRSGLAAARLLGRFGKSLIASDSRADLDRDALLAQLPPGTELILGENTFGDASIAVISPGIPITQPIVKQATIAGVRLVAEIEIGARAITTPMVAITGTDGKTTTTLLTAHLLREAGLRVTVAGNIGVPLCECIDELQESDVAVIEVSAFQLWTAPTFCPNALITTNIASDHHDYFNNDADYYARAKRRPLDVMHSDHIAVLNAEDPEISTWAHHGAARSAWYGRRALSELPSSTRRAGIEEGMLVLIDRTPRHELIACADLPLPGAHNQLNALAASLGALAMGADAAAISAGLRSFRAPPHRIETVCTRDGVTFINDSKATNPHAACAGLRTAASPCVLIAGGVDKQLDLTDWVALMQTQTAAVVLIGDLAPKLRLLLEGEGYPAPCVDADSMQHAVERAFELAKAHDAKTVLLSPGCSSFDMFKSYGHRGDVFREIARRLPE